MRIAVIDDEPNLIMLSSHIISEYGKQNNLNLIIDEYESGEDFLKTFGEKKYSIIFVDVYMPGLSGVDTVMELRKIDINVPVIFLTSSESHMKDAFNCHAFDYLVKPATKTAFFKVLDDCIQYLGASIKEEAKYIEFKIKNINMKLNCKDVVSVVSNGHNVILSASDNSKYDIKDTFTSISDSLSDCRHFLLINRGILINMDYVISIDNNICSLKNGEVFSIKVRAAKTIQQTFVDYRQLNS